MLYYIYNLVLSLLLSLCLFLMLAYRLHINFTYKNRHALSFLLPVLLTVAFMAFTVGITVPRTLDLVDVVAGRLEVNELDLSNLEVKRNLIVAEEQNYYYSPFEHKPDVDGVYRISYVKRSGFVIKMEEISGDPSQTSVVK